MEKMLLTEAIMFFMRYQEKTVINGTIGTRLCFLLRQSQPLVIKIKDTVSVLTNKLFSLKDVECSISLNGIGYGHIFPRTDWGKGLCIIYSLLGVPINGILIASLALFFGQKVCTII